jgi:hypothetical protein
MNEETTTETVEATETVSAEPIETVDSSEPISESTTSDWNGEVSSLQEADWFSSLDENIRGNVLTGLENKYKNWQRGYTDKFEQLSAQRKSLEDREEEIKASETRVSRWLYGDSDPLAETKKEMEALKEAHQTALEELKQERDELTEKLKSTHQGELGTLTEERDSLRKKLDEIEEIEKQKAEVEFQAAVTEFDTYLKENAPDILDNDDAFYSMCVLIASGTEPQDALLMVRGKYAMPAPAEEVTPEPAKPEPAPVPESINLMNMGTSKSAGLEVGERRDFASLMDAMRREAQGR